MVAGSSSISAAAPGDGGRWRQASPPQLPSEPPPQVPVVSRAPSAFPPPSSISRCQPSAPSLISILGPTPSLPPKILLLFSVQSSTPQIRCAAPSPDSPPDPQIPLPLETVQSLPFSDPAPLRPPPPPPFAVLPALAEPDPRFHPRPITQGSPEFQRSPGALRRGHGLRSTGRGVRVHKGPSEKPRPPHPAGHELGDADQPAAQTPA